MADAIRARSGFELLVEPQINIVNYRFVPTRLRNRSDEAADSLINDINKRLQKAQRQAGESFVSRTTLHLTRHGVERPITALRAVLANPLTTETDIDAVLNEQIYLAADSLTRSHSS
jgi:glutamate decarboxylase